MKRLLHDFKSKRHRNVEDAQNACQVKAESIEQKALFVLITLLLLLMLLLLLLLITMILLLNTFVFLTYFVDARCHYDFSNTLQVTNFTSLDTNNFGGYQGITGDSLVSVYHRSENESSLVEIQSAETFFSYTYDPDLKKPLDISGFKYFKVEANYMEKSQLNSQLNFGFTTSNECPSNITDLIIVQEWFTRTKFSTHLQNGYQVAYTPWKLRMNTTLSKLCLVLFEFHEYSKFYLHSLEFLNIKTTCDPVIPPSNENFVWRNQSRLVYKGHQFQYLSFLAMNFINGTAAEQEDLARTIVDFTNGTNLILKTTPLGVVPDASAGFDFSHCLKCYIFTNQSQRYNEHNLVSLDRSIAIAAKYGLKLVIPFFVKYFGLHYIIFQAGKSNHDDFYNDPEIIDAEKHFIGTILNRTNTITGIKYRDDPTIMSWSIGDDLTFLNWHYGPPHVWVKTISEYIKSLDPHHLIQVGWNADQDHSNPTFDDLMLSSIDCYIKQYTDISFEPLILPQVVSDFGKVYSLDVNAFDSYLGLSKAIESIGTESALTGVFVRNLFGRKEGDGFFMGTKGAHALHYPGVNATNNNNFDPREISVMHFLRVKYRFLFLDGVKDSPADPILAYPPKITSIQGHGQSPISLSISWFGTVGATMYHLLVSRNGGPLQEVMSSGDEFQDFTISIFGDSCISLTILLYGSYGNIKSSPSDEIHYISSACYTLQSTSTEIKSLANRDGVSLVLVTIPICTICLVSFLYCYLSQRRKQRSIRKALNNNGMSIENLKNDGLQMQAVKSETQFQERNSELIVPSDSYTLSITLANSSNPHELSIPGFLKMREGVDFQVSENDYLAKGNTAKVMVGKMRSLPGRSVAVKKFAFHILNDHFLFEIAVMHFIGCHENVVKLFGYQEKEPRMLILEKCDGNAFDLFVSNRHKYDPWFISKMVLKFVKDVARGCEHIHGCGIIHFDIKGGNILYQIIDEKDNLVFKVTDFGYSRLINSDSSNSCYVVSGLNIPDNFGFTVRYCAPEVWDLLSSSSQITFREELKKVDVYSYAIVVYEAISGNLCWGKNIDAETIRKNVINQKRPDFPETLETIILKDLVEQCWAQLPEKRPSFQVILRQLEAIKTIMNQYQDNLSNSSKLRFGLSKEPLESWSQFILRNANDPMMISMVSSLSAVVYSTLRRRLDVNLCQSSHPVIKVMSEDRRHRFTLFVVSTVNAALLSVFGLFTLAKPNFHPQLSYLVMSKGLGYFIYDLIETRRHWSKYPVDLVHHLFAVFLCGGALYTNTGLQEAPFFSLLEMSTVLINLNWIIRELDPKGHGNRISYKLISILFVILFATLRVYGYGRRILRYETGYGISPDSEEDRLRKDYLQMPGIVRFSYKGAYALQVFWFLKIIVQVKALIRGKAAGNSRT